MSTASSSVTTSQSPSQARMRKSKERLSFPVVSVISMVSFVALFEVVEVGRGFCFPGETEERPPTEARGFVGDPEDVFMGVAAGAEEVNDVVGKGDDDESV